MKTYEQIVKSESHTLQVITTLLDKSQWFAVEPWPDADYMVSVKIENKAMLEELILQVCKKIEKSIHIKWTQQGHSMLDPTGERTHDLKTRWVTCDIADVEKHEAEARTYAEAQNWITYEVYVQ